MTPNTNSMRADAGASVAHDALLETCEASAVGEHLAMHVDDHGFIVHEFACEMAGYPKWIWTVVLAHDVEASSLTVCDAVLLPGPDALVPPQWIPWSKRIQPGDLRPGDLLPSDPNDPRLTPGYTLDTSDAPESPDVLEAVWELGLGRERVLSLEGREDAAERWWRGETGPASADARMAPHPCTSCGFFVTIKGALGAGFGVCANEMSPADGKVVSVGFGCGAHSGVVAQATTASLPDVTLDENEYELVTIQRATEHEASTEPADSAADVMPTGEVDEVQDLEAAPEDDKGDVSSSPKPEPVATEVHNPDGGAPAHSDEAESDVADDLHQRQEG